MSTARTLSHARVIVSILTDELASVHHDALANAYDLAVALGDDLDRALASGGALNLVDAFNRADHIASDLARADHIASDLNSVRADVLPAARGRARGLANYLDRARSREQPGARRVVPSAARLLTTAARLLPATHRRRYAEEYRSELWDLAQAGGGRLRQWRYAFCQLRNAIPMSVALRSPRRRSSVP